ncbi:hypothetical protein ACIA78_26815 [Streptomyces xanthochromogenes]|uniref:hypothetical protein n=1 Tax=Streptomyces xanthochromogenes TaxID=67384 RepID=UPI0037AE1207
MPASFSYLPVVLLIVIGYAGLCAASPFGTCRKCKGWGSKVSTSRLTGRLKRGRECRRCHGYGRRVRIGRRVYNAVSRLRHEGTR